MQQKSCWAELPGFWRFARSLRSRIVWAGRSPNRVRKSRPEAAVPLFQIEPKLALYDAKRRAVLASIGHEADAHDAQDHHGPGRRFWNRRYIDGERTGIVSVKSRSPLEAKPVWNTEK